MHASWHNYFSGLPFDNENAKQAKLEEILAMLKSGAGAGAPSSVVSERSAAESVKIAALLSAFERVGHLVADLDPLKINEVYKDMQSMSRKYKTVDDSLLAQLDYKAYGFVEADLEREFFIELNHKSTILQQKKVWKLKEIIEAYRTAYCSKIGVEFMHIQEKDVCDWIRINFEGIQYKKLNDKEKIHLYDRLNWSHEFGTFTTQKFNTSKRFGLEGCESFIPGLKVAMDASIEDGANYFVIGMPHRGRLAVLANVVRKPMEIIMAEF